MVIAKATPEYTTLEPNFQPGAKHGHLSEIDPIFAQAKPTIDAMIEQIWSPSLSLEDFCKMWGANSPPAPGCPVEGEDVLTATQMIPMRDGHEIEIKTFTAKDKKPGSALMVKFHGGGWVVGGHNTEHSESLEVAGKTNTVVVSVDYRMAPKWKFPYAINDCFDATKWCQENAASLGVDANKTILIGGSAGSQLCSVVAIMARDAGLKGIVGQILAYPVTVHPKFAPTDKYEMKSQQQNSEASVVTAARLEWFLDQYMPEPTDDWRFSSLLAPSLKDLPPSLLLVAGYDPLRDEGLAYAERLQTEGNDIELHTYQGLPHCFYMLADHPKTQDYYRRILDFTKKVSA